MVYLLDCENRQENEMYKRAMIESRIDDSNRDQLQRFHNLDSIPPNSGSSNGSSIQTSHKDKGNGVVGMFRTYS